MTFFRYMDFIVLGPRLTVPLDSLLGFIVDSQDKRYGQLFRIGGMKYESDSELTYIHHICPDGEHYTSKNRNFKSGEWTLSARQNPDVAPPRIFYYRQDDTPMCNRMSLQGEGPLDFLRAIHIHKQPIEKIFNEYALLFGKPFPLRTDQNNSGNNHNGHI